MDVSGEIRASTGILFGTDTAAVNTLDDYEEGTWTPTYISTGADFSYTTQAGWYTKIGNLVIAQFHLYASASGTVTNSMLLGGLPFTGQGPGTEGAGIIAQTTFTTVPNLGGNINSVNIGMNQWGTITPMTPTTAGMNAGNKYLVGVYIYRSVD